MTTTEDHGTTYSPAAFRLLLARVDALEAQLEEARRVVAVARAWAPGHEVQGCDQCAALLAAVAALDERTEGG